ncbi:MAG: hypothetical protein WBV78_17915 [Roseobacter sp.]
MTDDDKASAAPADWTIAMAARATIELFGNGAIAKTREPDARPTLFRVSERFASKFPYSDRRHHGCYGCEKLQSSLTLMQETGGDSVIGIAIDEFYGGELCEQTLKMLS